MAPDPLPEPSAAPVDWFVRWEPMGFDLVDLFRQSRAHQSDGDLAEYHGLPRYDPEAE